MGEEAFNSDSMSQYIYTDMAPELHIKIKSLSSAKSDQTQKAASSGGECRSAAVGGGGSRPLVWTPESHSSRVQAKVLCQ